MTAEQRARERFERMWHDQYALVYAYVRRRVSDAESARDVTAETFLVAWRRLDAVPDEPQAWLLTTARNVLGNLYRTAARRRALVARLQVDTQGDEAAPADEAGTRAVAEAFNRLKQSDAEILALVAWDELKPREAARVLGISTPLFSVRLHRAKSRLRGELARLDPVTETFRTQELETL